MFRSDFVCNFLPDLKWISMQSTGDTWSAITFEKKSVFLARFGTWILWFWNSSVASLDSTQLSSLFTSKRRIYIASVEILYTKIYPIRLVEYHFVRKKPLHKIRVKLWDLNFCPTCLFAIIFYISFFRNEVLLEFLILS